MPRTRHVITRASLPLAASVLLAFVFSLSPEPASATTFSPTLDVTTASATPGANSDIVYDFRIPDGDVIFQDVVNFLPAEFGIATDADVPDGAVAGLLHAQATLGLVNAGCNTSLPVEFTLWESTTDLSSLPHGIGSDDEDGDGLVEFVTGYPEFLRRIFPGLQPVQRLYGQATIAGVVNIINFVVFEPGTQIPFFPAFDQALGYPTFAILNDPTYPPYPNAITDFCTPLTTINTVYGVTMDNPDLAGNQAGVALRTNPAADGTYTATSFVRSLWDADDDGIESNIDPCPYDPETVWDPTVSQPLGDNDLDGLPATCDPNDHQFKPDQDGDGFFNRQDRCPLQPDSSFDNDLDGIGDACDADPSDPADGGSSHRHVACSHSEIAIGAGGVPASPACPAGPDLPALNAYVPTLAIVGEVISLSASVQTKPGFGYYGSGAPGVTLDFTVTGANTAQGTCLTSNDGNCEFNYLGANLGIDTVTVSAPAFGIQKVSTLEWKEPPPHDDFANAADVPALPYETSADTRLATAESGEDGYCNYGSVWYEFTATEDTFLEAEIETNGGYANLGVYQGDTLATLEVVRCAYANAQLGNGDGYAYFLAEAGQTYYFGVSGYAPFDITDFAIDFGLSAVSGGVVTGDLTCDGEVGPQDSLLALKLDAGLHVPECATAFGDTDCDGYVGVLDSLKILAYDAGVPKPQTPACPAVATAFA